MSFQLVTNSVTLDDLNGVIALTAA